MIVNIILIAVLIVILGSASLYIYKAKKRGVYIVYANGSIVKAERGSSKTIQPGCEIIVPTREQTERLKTAEIISIGTGSASFAAIIISILNIIK